jgi:predicted nucleic acid-binding protein
LIDTGVLIDFSRTADPKLGGLFKKLPVAVCGVVRAELLHGARNPRDRARLVVLLDSFAQLPTPEPLWDVVGDSLKALRSGGVTVPFQDVVLATLAIANDIEL